MFGQPSFENPLSILWNPLDLVSFLRLNSLPAPLMVGTQSFKFQFIEIE